MCQSRGTAVHGVILRPHGPTGCYHPVSRCRAPLTPWTTTQHRRPPPGPAPPVPTPRPALTRPGNPADGGVPDRPGADRVQRVLRAVGNVGGHLAQVAPEAERGRQPRRTQGAGAGQRARALPVHGAGGHHPDRHPHRHVRRQGHRPVDRRRAAGRNPGAGGHHAAGAVQLGRHHRPGAGGEPDHLPDHRVRRAAAQAPGAAGAGAGGLGDRPAHARHLAGGQAGGGPAQLQRARAAAGAAAVGHRGRPGQRGGNTPAGQRKPRAGGDRRRRAQHDEPGAAAG